MNFENAKIVANLNINQQDIHAEIIHLQTCAALSPRAQIECALTGSGRAGRAAGRRRRSHRGRCGRAEGLVGGGEAGGQRAGRGHGGHRCAAETGDSLRQLAGHLHQEKIRTMSTSRFFFFFFNKSKCRHTNHKTALRPMATYHVGTVAGLFVRWRGSRWLAGQWGCGTAGVDAFLFLPAVAEPHSDHLLLHVKLLCDQQDLL